MTTRLSVYRSVGIMLVAFAGASYGDGGGRVQAHAEEAEPSILQDAAASNLAYCAYLGRLDDVRRLIAGGEDVDKRYEGRPGLMTNSAGAWSQWELTWTPLFAAVWGCRTNQLEIAEELIAAGADVNAMDGMGWTPLHYFGGCRESCGMALLLLRSGANAAPKMPTWGSPKNWSTPLHETVSSACSVGALLVYGADVDARNARGETALHRAVKGGYVETVQLLLQAGANPNATNRDGRSPLDFAAAFGNSAVPRSERNAYLRNIGTILQLLRGGSVRDAAK